MSDQTLDEFFAKADDVLTDWAGDTDAMRWEVGDGPEPEAELAESYYEQIAGDALFDAFLAIVEAVGIGLAARVAADLSELRYLTAT